MTFFPPLARTFEVGQDGRGRGALCEGKRVRRKQGEDRVNEMASKDELNGGRKETRSDRALLIDSSQTHSFERRRGVPKPKFLSSALQKAWSVGCVSKGLRQGVMGCVHECKCVWEGHPSFSHTSQPFNREVRDLHTVGGSEVAGITRLL